MSNQLHQLISLLLALYGLYVALLHIGKLVRQWQILTHRKRKEIKLDFAVVFGFVIVQVCMYLTNGSTVPPALKLPLLLAFISAHYRISGIKKERLWM